MELQEPMLSAKEKLASKLLSLIRYPKLMSPKMDGIRCFVHGGIAYSRKLKPIPNQYVQWVLGHDRYNGFDGELIVGKPWDFNVMQQTMSGVMSRGDEPDFFFYVFDDFSVNGGFQDRLDSARVRIASSDESRLKHVPHTLVRNEKELLEYERKCLDRGYEGAMARTPDGPYKHGRSSMKENWLIAVKRFIDFEAEIVEVHEMMHNENEATVNELGRTKRSTHKANRSGLDTFGGFTARTREGVNFRCGGGKGLTASERARLWAIRDTLPGQWGKFESLPIGVKQKPRLPAFLGLRHPDDMGD